MIVLDASLIIAHVLGESTIAVDSSIFDTLKGDRVTVPAHWSAEVASALTNNARRGRLSQADITLILKQSMSLISSSPNRFVWKNCRI